MKISTNWVGYIDRTASAIRSSVLKALSTNVPELTDRSSSNLLIILIDIFAGVSELLNYYIDTTARELFLPTARRFSSVLKQAFLVNYNGKARVTAFVSVELVALDSLGNPVAVPSDFEIPMGTIFRDKNGNTWLSVTSLTFRKDYSSIVLELSQYETITDDDFGVSDGSLNMMIKLPTEYAHESLDVKVGAEYWNRVDDLGFSKPDSKDFQVKMQMDGGVYLVFGDGVTGAVPPIGSPILGSYKATTGTGGNIPSDYIKNIVTLIPVLPPVASYSVSNPNPGYGGKSIEGIEEIRKATPLSLRTLHRAVSRQDYLDVTLLAPGVRGVTLGYDCGLGVLLFVVPEGGGNPTQAFLNSVETFVKQRGIAGFPTKILPSGETHIHGIMRIQGRYRVTETTILKAVTAALIDLYSPYKSNINQAVRQSDIISTVDNLPEVDFLVLEEFWAEPYLRPSNLSIDLQYSIKILMNSNVIVHWKLVYNYVNDDFQLYKDNVSNQALTPGTVYNIDGIMEIVIPSVPANLVANDSWTFTTYPYSKDVELDDMSIPIIGPNDFTFIIQETNG